MSVRGRLVAQQHSFASKLLVSDRSKRCSPHLGQNDRRRYLRGLFVQVAASDPDQQQINLQKDDGEATFAPLDASSSGGLGGTSSDVFGPLVRLMFRAVSHTELRLA